uniref:Uncharacterized protein n=1 Tax=Plectus sambesii TaxID=2011161 RepID=A0A914VJ54_9BILA
MVTRAVSLRHPLAQMWSGCLTTRNRISAGASEKTPSFPRGVHAFLATTAHLDEMASPVKQAPTDLPAHLAHPEPTAKTAQ